MKLNEKYSIGENVVEKEVQKQDAINGLSASLNSSSSIQAILDCAEERWKRKELAEKRWKRIQNICKQYEEHQKTIRDHCLDVSSLRQGEFPEWIDQKTDNLLKQGKSIFSELSEAILLFS